MKIHKQMTKSISHPSVTGIFALNKLTKIPIILILIQNFLSKKTIKAQELVKMKIVTRRTTATRYPLQKIQNRFMLISAFNSIWMIIIWIKMNKGENLPSLLITCMMDHWNHLCQSYMVIWLNLEISYKI